MCSVCVLDVLLQTSPSLAEDPSVVCPPPFLSEGPSVFCPRHIRVGRILWCFICALGYSGWASLVMYLCLGTRTQCYFAAVA